LKADWGALASVFSGMDLELLKEDRCSRQLAGCDGGADYFKPGGLTSLAD
jgi:hypothetical protein